MSGTDSKTTSDNSSLITEVDLKLHKILFPYAAKQVSDVEQNGTRFVHYTNATGAAEILRNAEFWMREPSCMNDYMEVEHGLRCIDASYSGDGSGKNRYPAESAGITGRDKTFQPECRRGRRSHGSVPDAAAAKSLPPEFYRQGGDGHKAAHCC